jgi:uncharacterized protein Veg
MKKTNSLILGLMMMVGTAQAAELPKTIECRNDQSIAKSIFEGIRNHVRIGNRSGYYTSAFIVEFTKSEDEAKPSYQMEMLGEQAICSKNEQCAGLYTIFSGKMNVTINQDQFIQLENHGNIATINFETGECKVKISDVRIKKRLSRFKGELTRKN